MPLNLSFHQTEKEQDAEPDYLQSFAKIQIICLLNCWFGCKHGGA
jgi:hypothetical protein